MAKFSVDVDPTSGEVRVVVDGVDVSELVAGVETRIVRGEQPKMFLELTGAGDVHADGDVLRADLSGDVVGTIDQILASIDPVIVEKRVLDNLGWNNGDTPAATTKATIDTVRELLRESASGT